MAVFPLGAQAERQRVPGRWQEQEGSGFVAEIAVPYPARLHSDHLHAEGDAQTGAFRERTRLSTFC